jgi:hypothetical protein
VIPILVPVVLKTAHSRPPFVQRLNPWNGARRTFGTPPRTVGSASNFDARWSCALRHSRKGNRLAVYRGEVMATAIPVGSDVSAGTYRCENCGYELVVQSVQSMPSCPNCGGPYSWEAKSGGDSKDDPYPDE